MTGVLSRVPAGVDVIDDAGDADGVTEVESSITRVDSRGLE